MLPPALLLFLAFALGRKCQCRASRVAIGTPTNWVALPSLNGVSSAAARSTSSVIGPPTDSAALPSLSETSSCVGDRLGLAAAAANCSSEVAVNSFCGAPLCMPSLLPSFSPFPSPSFPTFSPFLTATRLPLLGDHSLGE
ncbi:hypothetical protein FB451DRAFT_1415378 [Mycena latifolia]|nr:hypothetical protein FB451DRAFT_1415378 [Mycena latifolia]